MGLGALLNESCGCVITTGVDWDPLTIIAVRALEKKIGQASEFGDALNQIVLLARSGQGHAPVSVGTKSRYFVFQIGNAPMVAPSVEIAGTAFNGKVFTFPALKDAIITSIHSGRSYDVPEPDGYNFDPSTGRIEFANDLYNVNLYVTAIWIESDGTPTTGGGSIVLTVPSDGIDTITSPLLVGKMIGSYTHGNVTGNKGFVKGRIDDTTPEQQLASDTFRFIDGTLLYTDAPLTLDIAIQ